MKTYSLIMLYQWAVVGCICLGFYSMNRSLVDELRFVAVFGDLSAVSGFVAGLIVNVFLLLGIGLALPAGRKKIIQLFDSIELLLPNGWKERLLFAGVAVTAGFCEEVIYRGFMFYYLDELGIGLSTMSIAVITSVLFGLAHYYQGWKNVIVTGLVGFAMARLFMSYDNLWIPIIVHIIIDLRFAVLPNMKKVILKFSRATA